jgi:hypothetical protein
MSEKPPSESAPPPLAVVSSLSRSALPPPRTLGEAGLALWNRLLSVYDLRDLSRREQLWQACDATDRADRLRAAISADGEVIRVNGATRAHPLLREELLDRDLCSSAAASSAACFSNRAL